MNKALKAYCREQIKVLKDFGVYVTPEQKLYMQSLPSEIAMENYKRKLLGLDYSPSKIIVKCRPQNTATYKLG